MIDWSKAPDGTTHAMTVGCGDTRWYRVGDCVECWSATIGWTASFFLTRDEFKDAGMYLYELGEQPEGVTMRKQRDELLAALIEVAATLSWNAFGECRAIHDGPIMPSAMAVEMARAAIAKCTGEQE